MDELVPMEECFACMSGNGPCSKHAKCGYCEGTGKYRLIEYGDTEFTCRDCGGTGVAVSASEGQK